MEYEESYYYADGSFEISANAIAEGSMSDCQIGRYAKGTFDATVLNVGNIRTNTFDVSDETLEKMADSIDFSVIS